MKPRNPTMSTRTSSKKKSCTENFMEMILDIINQNIQETLKKFQDTKNKEYEKTQKQINELIGALNKQEKGWTNGIS
jgi:hypothetical protein